MDIPVEKIRDRKVLFVTEDIFSGKYLSDMYDLLLPAAEKVCLMSLMPEGTVRTGDAVSGILQCLERNGFSDSDIILALGDDYCLGIAGTAAEKYLNGMECYEIRQEIQ